MISSQLLRQQAHMFGEESTQRSAEDDTTHAIDRDAWLQSPGDDDDVRSDLVS